jgi:hypothetical protein
MASEGIYTLQPDEIQGSNDGLTIEALRKAGTSKIGELGESDGSELAARATPDGMSVRFR